MGQSLAIPRVIPNDWKRLDLIINKIKMRLGRDSTPTFSNINITNVITASTSVFSEICTVAAGLSVLRVTGLQTDATALTGTLRGAYIDVSNGALDATGTIRAMELKARTEAPGDTGNDVAVLEGLSISADSKGHGVTTMRAAEFILDGFGDTTIDEAVGLRIANNLQADKATLSYGLQIYRDSFDYTYDISLSLGGHITGDSYVNQDLRTTASPIFAGLTVGANTDIEIALGRWRLGYVDGFSDMAVLSHYDHFDTLSAALIQTASGNTYVGCDAGNLLYFVSGANTFARFWVDGTQKMFSLSTSTLGFGGAFGSDRIEITHAAGDILTIESDYGNVTINLSGKLTAGAWGSPIDVTNTRKYGFEFHYSGNNYDVFGIRSRANLITTDASTRTATGAELQAANTDGIDVNVLCGAKCSSSGKSTSNSATISYMRAVDLITEWSAKDTVTNLYNTHIKCITRTAAGEGSFGTGYGIYLENIAVGGTGQALDAGIYFKGTDLSGGNKAFIYGIDFSGGTYSSEEIKLANGSVIGSDKVTLQPTTDSTTFFQILDADGGTPILNVDTVNEKWITGGTTPTAFGEVVGMSYPVFRGRRISNITHLTAAGLDFIHETSGNMIDGFGGGITLSVEDATSGPQIMGAIYAIRDGADNCGGLLLRTRNFGVWKDNIWLDPNGYIGINESAPETLLELTYATPYITLHNSTHEDTDGGRESRINFKGEKDTSGDESTLARIEVSHNGSGADEKGKIVISTNDGDDGDTPTDRVKIDAAGNTYIGDGGTTNYTHIDSGGRLLLEGTAQTWEDLRIIPGAFQFPGTADPTLENWRPGGAGATYKVYKFKKNDEVHFTCQLPHAYKEGSDIKAHIHWTPCDRGNEENGNTVGWKIDYSWANTDAAFGASATIDLSHACSGTDDLHELTASGTITGTAKTISSILVIRLYRSDTDSDDTWVGATAALSPAILEFDLHFEVDSLGSDLELVK